MELNVIKAIAVLIGLVLLWLVVKSLTQRTPQVGHPNVYPTNNYPAPTGNGYPHPGGYPPAHQESGCLQVLALIGFLAVCAACVILGIILAGNLQL